MQCEGCGKRAAPDAAFCTECGRSLNDAMDTAPQPTRSGNTSVFMIALALVMALVTGIGYYRFFLPDGVAAFVNDEVIRLSELNAAVARERGTSKEVPPSFRYQVLHRLIMERIQQQEARREGMSVSREELSRAEKKDQAVTGLDYRSFRERVASQYGDIRAYEAALERRLLVRKLIVEKTTPHGSDPRSARETMDRWSRDAASRASVRIALAEQFPATKCGCCDIKGGEDVRAETLSAQNSNKQQPEEADRMRSARDAALRHWHAHHVPDAVETRQKDFGCYIQVDILQREKTIASLRYQNGIITEQ